MTKKIHIIAPFLNADEGDWQAIDLYLKYNKNHSVSLWSPQTPNKKLNAQFVIQEIKPYSGQMPIGGMLVICGAHTSIGTWYEQAMFDKVVLYHNLLSPTILYKTLNRLSLTHQSEPLYIPNIEIIYVSKLVKHYAGLAGVVEHPIPPTSHFKPLIKKYNETNLPFIVGRISADILAKHHHSNLDVYKSLISSGISIRIAGGTCLSKKVAADVVLKNKVYLLPTVPQIETPQFYNNLDCFYYRVASTVKEPYGFAVAEAMLSGLPVVCHEDIGASELINHGVNGFVFKKSSEAIEIINSLKNNANICKEVGMQASKLGAINASNDS